MSTPRSLPIGQGWFLDKAKVIVGKELYNEAGMCYGYIIQAAAYATSQSLLSFSELLQRIHYGPTKPEEKDHVIDSKKKTELVIMAKRYLETLPKEKEKTKTALFRSSKISLAELDEINKDTVNYFENVFKGKEEVAIDWIFSGTPAGYPEVITPEQLNSLIQIAQGLAAYYARYARTFAKALPINDYMQMEWENARLQQLIDIKIFFILLAKIQKKDKVAKEFFIGEKRPRYFEEMDVLFPLLAPIELDREEKGKVTTCMKRIASFAGMYNDEQLLLFFKSLQESLLVNLEKLKKQLNPISGELPFLMTLGNAGHIIGISFNAYTKKFIILDACNAFPSEIELKNLFARIHNGLKHGDPTHLMQHDPENPVITFDTNIIIDSELILLTNIFNRWQKSETFKIIHETLPRQKPEFDSENRGTQLDQLLYLAVMQDNISTVEKCLSAGANPRIVMLSLSAYASAQRIETYKLIQQALLQRAKQQPINYPDNGISPQSFALFKKTYEAIDLDKKLTADEKIKKYDLFLEIHKICVKLTEAVKHLPDNHSDKKHIIKIINAAYENPYKDFFKHAYSDLFWTYKEPSILNIVKLLRKNCFSQEPNVPALQIAIEYKDNDLFHFLLSQGDKTIESLRGDNPFTLLASEGHTELVKNNLPFLYKMETERKDNKGPLRLAAEEGHAEIVKFLLEYNIASDSEIKATSDAASENGHLNIVKICDAQIKRMNSALSPADVKIAENAKTRIRSLRKINLPIRNNVKLLLLSKINAKNLENINAQIRAVEEIDRLYERWIKLNSTQIDFFNEITQRAYAATLNNTQKDLQPYQQALNAFRDIFFLADNLTYKPYFFQSWFAKQSESQTQTQQAIQAAIDKLSHATDIQSVLACKTELEKNIINIRDRIAKSKTADPLVTTIDAALKRINLF